MAWGENRAARQESRAARRAARSDWRKQRLAARGERQKTRQGFLTQLAPTVIGAFASKQQPGLLLPDGSVYEGGDEQPKQPTPPTEFNPGILVAIVVVLMLLKKKK